MNGNHFQRRIDSCVAIVSFLLFLLLSSAAMAQPASSTVGSMERSERSSSYEIRALHIDPRGFLQAGSDSLYPSITLHNRFFRAPKFIYGDHAPQNVYNFWGISYREELRDVLAQHPAALKEAKKATVYRAVATAGMLTLVGMSAKILIDSINDSQDISAGRFPDEGSGSSDLAIIVVAGGVGIFSALQAKKHLKNGVKIFNEEQKQKQQTGISNK